MMKLFFSSLKFRITLASVLLVASAIAGVVFYIQQEMEKINRAEQYKNTQTLLKSVHASVENQYKSILFHKKTMLAARKDELQSVLNMVHSSLQGFNELAEAGILSKQEAQERAREELRQFRYKHGVGYVWINDMGKPYPKMIMHPTMSYLDGQILNAPEFNCALGQNENLFKASVNIVGQQGEGFVDYQWPKPTQDGLTKLQPKISFVKLFTPWGWVIGSGLYVDDIEQHVNRRIDEVLGELNGTFGKIKIAESGYIFIFNGQSEMMYHPLYKGDEVAELINPATGNKMLNDLMLAADQPDGKIEYIWDKPLHKGDFRFKKMAFVHHFKPLDWYISSSFYVDELERPAKQLRRKALIFSLIFLFIAVALALYAAHSITRPLQRIIDVFATGARGNYSARIKIERRDEFGTLATYFNKFMVEIAQSHTQLSMSETRFRSLFEKSIDGRAIIEDEHFTECNEAVVRMLHYNSKEDILNMHPADLSPEFQPDGSNSADKAGEMIRLAQKNGSHRFLWHHTRSDGEIFPVDVELTTIPYKDKKIIHASWRDITEQQEMEQRLIQAQKMETIGTLAGGIAHDFNNILTAIFGYTELATMHIGKKEKLQDDLREVRQAGGRAKSLVQQILTFSRKSEQTKRPLQMALIVKEVVKLLRSTLPTTIEIRQQIKVTEQTVLADPTQIHQILMNLCTNAHHAMRETGGILGVLLQEKVIARDDKIVGEELAPGHYLELEISDTGVGMDAITSNKIFEPYFTTKEVGEGTGLGLAVVHGIVQDYQGVIHVDSKPNQGTTFRVYLPVVDQQTIDSNKDVATIDETGTGHILFVDDEKKILTIAGEIFPTYGYQISTFATPNEALASFKENPNRYDLLITDMTMPQMTGIELATTIMTLKPDFPVILCTGYSELINRESALALGILEYVSKPIIMSELVTVVKKIFNTGGIS